MLSRLVIKNVALISNLNMEFDQGLNILSGETGAGKSIIVDSLMLLLGGRYDRTLLKYGEESGFVEGYFSSVNPTLFEEIGLEIEEDAIIRRSFSKEGKNDIRINGQSVTLSMLKRFSCRLVDIYGQNEHQALSNPAKHLDILDYYLKGQSTQLFAKLSDLVTNYNQAKRRLLDIGDEGNRRRNIDILKYQIEEIKAAKVLEGEEDELIERRKIILSYQRIKTALGEAMELLSGEGNGLGIVDLLRSLLKPLSHISSISDSYEELSSRASSMLMEADDVLQTINSELENMDCDKYNIDDIEKRLDIVRTLKRKYGDFHAMNRFLDKAAEELDFLLNADDLYESLSSELLALKRAIFDVSKEISDARKECAVELTKKVVIELAELSMQDSRFEIVFFDFPSFDDCEGHISKNGMDSVEFYLSANLGQPLLPLAKIISGGEMSRFMLALKVISAGIDTAQTMIFDEIDAGISGVVGRTIAQKLARISRLRQVICVTHLPQIAAMADVHYYITKQTTDVETLTTVSRLTLEEMIGEISRLSGGQDISTQAMTSAREIKEWSESYKKTC